MQGLLPLPTDDVPQPPVNFSQAEAYLIALTLLTSKVGLVGASSAW